ncbi:FtsW/RodA/SpoVE family cell cycle protein [uncultured Alistipes sp.]|uniref:FtsW/RodA/SpoVE family cell cycle protein n=1 Tax=uncultured Alistipes sp. TaxID=538949 RepID=UPI00261868F9|nr:FtsW/RodA/SpoVE family cell cycle protein [uncultured Alistipes sp.]
MKEEAKNDKTEAAGGEEQAAGFKLITGDRVLWVIIVALAVISILVVYSSTAKMAYDAHTARSTAHFLRQQLMLLIICIPLVIITHKINARIYNRLSLAAYAISILLTTAVYFIGATTNGAARWIPLGPFQLQPSEALKIATVLFLARQLAGRQSTIDKIRIIPSLNPFRWKRPDQKKIWREGTWPILFPVLLSCVVIFPAHTSSAVLVFFTSWVMMLIGRVRMKELLKLLGLAFAAVMLAGFLNLGRSETAGGRVETWIDLWTSSQTEKPIDKLTDTERSMIAIHNGGLLGEGAGQSAMRVEMIHPESDYAYAFFVEEYGIILAVALLLLYLWIFFRAIEIFRRCGTAFPGLLVLGLALLITCQALLHIMVTVNLIPETGQTLPLISRGGSSMIFTAIALGMILSVSRQNDEQSHDMPKSESLYEK